MDLQQGREGVCLSPSPYGWKLSKLHRKELFHDCFISQLILNQNCSSDNVIFSYIQCRAGTTMGSCHDKSPGHFKKISEQKTCFLHVFAVKSYGIECFLKMINRSKTGIRLTPVHYYGRKQNTVGVLGVGRAHIFII